MITWTNEASFVTQTSSTGRAGSRPADCGAEATGRFRSSDALASSCDYLRSSVNVTELSDASFDVAYPATYVAISDKIFVFNSFVKTACYSHIYLID